MTDIQPHSHWVKIKGKVVGKAYPVESAGVLENEKEREARLVFLELPEFKGFNFLASVDRDKLSPMDLLERDAGVR